MDIKEIKDQLNTLKDQNARMSFALKDRNPDQGELVIFANRNGIIAFTDLLLDSLDGTSNYSSSEIPLEFYDDESDVVIKHVKIQGVKPKNKVDSESQLTQILFFGVCISVVAIFVVGCITVISWLNNLL
jgi:hypothetical protein